jgi:hypothetical protein
VGTPVCVFSSYSSYELEEILSVTGSSITLTGNLVSTWPIGTEVYPVLQGYIDAKVTASNKTSIYGGLGLRQREAFDEDAERLLGSHGFSKFNGFDLFNRKPNWASGMQIRTQRRIFNQKTLAIEYVKNYQAESDLLLKFNHTLFSKAELYEVISFFNSKLGKWKQFWIPTWTKDIIVTAAIGSSDTTLTIEDIDYQNSWSGNVTVGKWLYFLLPDGTEEIREVTGWPSATSITISSSLGVDVSAEELPFLLCSFLVASRFNSDELEVQHLTSQISEITFNSMSLADDPMVTTTTT